MATITRGAPSDIAVLPDYVEHAAPRATRQQVSRWLTYSQSHTRARSRADTRA